MHKVLILACCAVSISLTLSNYTNITSKLVTPLRKNGSLLNVIVEKASSKNLSRFDLSRENGKNTVTNSVKSLSNGKHKKSFDKKQDFYATESTKTLPFLHKIHARITRSKDAVWATITLTFMCVLLVLAVAQSRMWKDHYYTEAQGVPLPNFNERVLFKDVMERKVISLKQFFNKKSKEKNVTELESLLPPSEWDN